MPESNWRGRKQEKQRLYWRVREERKQVVRKKYERVKAHLGERGRSNCTSKIEGGASRRLQGARGAHKARP
jgi:hypothetical protein